MKKIALLFVATSLAIASTSFAQPARFQQVIEYQIAPVHQMAFENLAKKIKEAAEKTNSSMTWTTVQVTVGKPAATYRVVLSFNKWAERDQWGSVPGVLTEAFGEQEATRLYRDGRIGIVSETSRIWEYLEDSSSHPRTGEPANYYQVAIRHVRPEMVPEFREIQRGFRAAFEPITDGPSFTRWILRAGEGSNTTFRRTQPFDTWAERDTGGNGGQILIEHQGEEARRLNLETLNRAVERMDIFYCAYRPDLSRRTTSPTSD